MNMPTQKTKKPAQSKKKPSGPKPGHVYVLRVVNKYGRSYNDFQWPEKGEVSAPDWEPTA